MKNNTFFLIPDISGFTKFVSQTEISHGQHIISELLELLIDANELDLTMGEIEGDAILFYKKGQTPDKNQLAAQAQKMFVRFHQHLKKYQSQRICECGACRSASNLSLKIIAHTGASDFITVKGHLMPYGPDVILVHRLLKNDVKLNEYLLWSDQFMKAELKEFSLSDFPWLDLKQASTHYESLGTVDYYYSPLSSLHQLVPEPQPVSSFQTERPLILETLIERSRDDVFEIIIDLEQRMKWNNFANDVEFETRALNQVGTRHVCVFDTHSIEFESVSADFGLGNLVYGEKVLDLPFFARDITIYFMVGSHNNGARVQMQIHYQLKSWGVLFTPFFRKKTTTVNNIILKQLKEYCEQKSS